MHSPPDRKLSNLVGNGRIRRRLQAQRLSVLSKRPCLYLTSINTHDPISAQGLQARIRKPRKRDNLLFKYAFFSD